jgi:hypothetical protein
LKSARLENWPTHQSTVQAALNDLTRDLTSNR